MRLACKCTTHRQQCVMDILGLTVCLWMVDSAADHTCAKPLHIYRIRGEVSLEPTSTMDSGKPMQEKALTRGTSKRPFINMVSVRGMTMATLGSFLVFPCLDRRHKNLKPPSPRRPSPLPPPPPPPVTLPITQGRELHPAQQQHLQAVQATLLRQRHWAGHLTCAGFAQL